VQLEDEDIENLPAWHVEQIIADVAEK